MAQEYTGSLKANFFPSEDSYTTNKGSLTETDISFIPANTIVETYQDGTEWYRVFSDGWVEQGGFVAGSGYNTKTITFLKPMADTNYLALNTSSTSSSVTSGYGGMSSLTTTTVVSYCHNSHRWYVCGMGAT